MAQRDFKKRVKKAVSDESLDTALGRATASYAKSRAHVFEGLDYEGLRDRLRECKLDALSRIPELFEQFKREAEAVGVRVYEAADSGEANRIVLDIARYHNARKIVKSKSMVTEEIELNRHLLADGMEVTETDLGEWIIQLAGERPSNTTIPAIHKTREQVAELFSNVTGEEVPPDIPTLVAVARKHIRQKFIEADLGISGANILIADTGTLVIISNEGNARLVTSLPDVHIAVVSYEKLVPSLDEAAAVLKLLARSGTGQKLTTYTSFITGPSRTSDIEKTLTLGCHGPKEVHVVFVDNGRLALLDDPEFREALCCLKCGACLSVCPVYRSVGGHVFGNMYFGGIGAVLEAFLVGLESVEDTANLCSTCGRCVSYCPSRIDVPRMIAGLRRKLSQARGRPWLERAVLNALGSPPAFEKGMSLLRAARNRVMPGLNSIDVPFLGLTRFRPLPVLAPKPLRDLVPYVSEPVGTKKGMVAFYPGCMIEHVYPSVGEGVIRTLTRLGWEVRLPDGLGCCGVPALLKGDVETARKLAEWNAGVGDFAQADYVITACPTCLSTLKEETPRLIGSIELASKVRDFSEFLVNTAGVKPGDLTIGQTGSASEPNAAKAFPSPPAREDSGAPRVYSSHACPIAADRRVTYHDPCHARHRLGIGHEPRELLEMAGYEVVEMHESDACCGFAGSYSLSFPEVSESILSRKLANIQATGAQTVVTDCPGCLLQLRGGLEKAGIPVRALHTAELLGGRQEGEAPAEPPVNERNTPLKGDQIDADSRP